MKKIIFLTFFLVLSTFSYASGKLKNSFGFKSIYLFNNQEDIPSSNKMYIPTENEIEIALSEATKEMDSVFVEEEWKKTFSIQVYGFERNKHKFIYFQFLDYGENSSDFDKHILEICDGGYGVWECEYNITKKQIVYITHHGFAMIKPQNKFC